MPSKPSLQVRQVQVLGVKVAQLGFWQSSQVAPFKEKPPLHVSQPSQALVRGVAQLSATHCGRVGSGKGR